MGLAKHERTRCRPRDGPDGFGTGERKEPTNVEREIYELTRLPPPAWCHHGAKGRGVKDPRKGLTLEWSVSILPVIAFDFCFRKTSRTVCGMVTDDGVSCLVLEDVDTGYLLVVPANAMTVTDYMVERSRRFAEHFFRRRVRLLCDGEPASVALAGKLKERRSSKPGRPRNTNIGCATQGDATGFRTTSSNRTVGRLLIVAVADLTCGLVGLEIQSESRWSHVISRRV